MFAVTVPFRLSFKPTSVQFVGINIANCGRFVHTSHAGFPPRPPEATLPDQILAQGAGSSPWQDRYTSFDLCDSVIWRGSYNTPNFA